MDRFIKCSRVVEIKHDRATIHPAQAFYTKILMFELPPLVTFKRAIFHVESRNTDVCAELHALFCHTISSQRLQRFRSGGTFYTVYLLRVCVGSRGETDNRNRRNSLILMFRSSTQIHRHSLILSCMIGMKTVSPVWWYKRRPVFSQARGETGKRPTVRLHNWEVLRVPSKISDSGLQVKYEHKLLTKFTSSVNNSAFLQVWCR